MPISDHIADREHGKFVEVGGQPVVRVANADGSAISAGGGGGTSMVDDAAFTVGGSSITPIGFLADESSPDSIDEGDVGLARMSLDRRQYVIVGPNAAAPGLSMHLSDALLATPVAVKASAGRVHGYHLYNPNSAAAFVHFYDLATGDVTVGTSTRKRTLWIPGGGAIDGVFSMPLAFGTAITIAATTTISGTTAPSSGLLANVDYV
jgi:hypothetical protein